jgi:predicted GNAT family N-acyltransferase
MGKLEFVEINILDNQQKLTLMQLWNNEYPTNLAYKTVADFEKYLDNLKDLRHILLVDKTNEILGWIFCFTRDNNRWFAIILSDSIQGKGLGRLSLDKLKALEQELNGWVIDNNLYIKSNGQKYLSPLEFYQKTGFCILTDKRLELDHFSAVQIKWTR